MTLNELLATGTYVAVKPTAATRALVADWARKAGVTLVDDLHVTLLYSRRVLPVVLEPYLQHRATPTSLGPLGTVKLVVKLDSPSLVQRHYTFRHAGHTHDFDTFVPHMTLVKEEEVPKELPPMEFGLAFESEYTEALRE